MRPLAAIAVPNRASFFLCSPWNATRCECASCLARAPLPVSARPSSLARTPRESFLTTAPYRVGAPPYLKRLGTSFHAGLASSSWLRRGASSLTLLPRQAPKEPSCRGPRKSPPGESSMPGDLDTAHEAAPARLDRLSSPDGAPSSRVASLEGGVTIPSCFARLAHSLHLGGFSFVVLASSPCWSPAP